MQISSYIIILISLLYADFTEPYYVFVSTGTTKYDGYIIFISRTRSGIFFACFYAHARVMTQSEESGSELQVKILIDSLQVIGVAICDN